MTRKISIFAGNASGTAAIEFALLGSVFFLLLLGHFEVARLLFLQHRLDDATVVASRAMQLGVAQQAQDDTAQKFRDNRLCPALGSFLDCSRVIVDVGILPVASSSFDGNTWSGVAVGSLSGNRFCIGSTGQYMFLRVSYPQPPLLSTLLPDGMFTTYAGERVTMLQSFAAWRNEPVDAQQTGPCQ